MIYDMYQPIAEENTKAGTFLPVNFQTIKIFLMLLGLSAVSDVIALGHANLIMDVIISMIIMLFWTYMISKRVGK